MWVSPVLLLAASALSAASPRAPVFSWRTISPFFHSSNQTGPFSDHAITVIAKFPMVTIEKFQGACAHSPHVGPSCHQEDLITSELGRVKAIAPHVCAIFYYNSVLNFPQYQLWQTMQQQNQSLLLHDAAGRLVRMSCPSPVGHCDVFDFSVEQTRELFAAECVNATRTGVVDGCFLDRSVDGTPTDPTLDPTKPGNKYNLTHQKAVAYSLGHVQVLTELQAAISPGPVIANHAYGPPLTNLAAGSVNFAMIEGFTPNNQSIWQLVVAARNNRGVQAHVGGCGSVTVHHFAAFLVGAGTNSFFGCGPWTSPWDGGLDISSAWLKQYDYLVGAPEGEAVIAGKIWTRKFTDAGLVTFDVGSNEGSIANWPA